jgi:hypothetical protein
MAAYTDTLGFNKGTAAIPAYGPMREGWIEVELDFAAIAAARLAAGATALTSTDTLVLFPTFAGMTVLAVGAHLKKAEGATATIDVGDAASGTRYFSNLNLNDTANTYSVSTLDAPHVYNVTTGVLITLDHASIDTAHVHLYFKVATLVPSH